jgi:hypothetical protein
MLVHVVADYGPADLAFAEVQQRLALELPEAQIVPTAVGAFDTLAAGFCVAQLALTPGPTDRIIMHNVAPRRDDRGARRDNAGEPFCVARTHDGVLVVGAHAGHCLSFLAPHVDEIRRLAVPDAGSQFRSRDLLPAAVAALARGEDALLGAPLPPDEIPAVPEGVIAYVDGYGNLKTTVTDAPAAAGQRISVRIADVDATAIVSDGTFAVPEGELALAPGSSGWQGRDGRHLRFYELLLRGGSAAARFGDPQPGAAIDINNPLSHHHKTEQEVRTA